jgi:hypothetical protein
VLLIIALVIIELLPRCSEYLLYNRIVSGYHGKHPKSDIGFFITQKTWERIIPTLICHHASNVAMSRDDPNKQQINLKRYNEQLNLWNALLDAHEVIGNSDIFDLIDCYFMEYLQSGEMRKDEFANLAGHVQWRNKKNTRLNELTSLLNSSPYAKDAKVNLHDDINVNIPDIDNETTNNE